MQRPKRVAAIHDISSFGRCALSVIVPVISAMGIQVCPVPTAVLSTHTGGFTDIAVARCHDFPAMADRHWRSCGIDIDCIYSGYLGDAGQIEQIINFKAVRPGAFLVVDPVMGDDGEIYSGISAELISDMRRLCERADLITPNTTEAALLLGREYSDKPILRSEAAAMLRELTFGEKTDVIITGCRVEGLGVCNLGLKRGEKAFAVPCNYIGGSYPGTGDIFTSVVTGSLLNGKNLSDSVKAAADFCEECISLTVDSGEPERDGVFIEYAIPSLFKKEFNRRAVEL